MSGKKKVILSKKQQSPIPSAASLASMRKVKAAIKGAPAAPAAASAASKKIKGKKAAAAPVGTEADKVKKPRRFKPRTISSRRVKRLRYGAEHSDPLLRRCRRRACRRGHHRLVAPLQDPGRHRRGRVLSKQ